MDKNSQRIMRIHLNGVVSEQLPINLHMTESRYITLHQSKALDSNGNTSDWHTLFSQNKSLIFELNILNKIK